MQLLVVAATEMEIAPLLAHNISADFLITGVGVPACVYKLAEKIRQNKYDLAIQAGIAGTFNPVGTLADTVLVEKDLFADLGIFENGRLSSLFDAGLANKDEWPYNNGWLLNETSGFTGSTLRKVTAVTVNTVSEDKSIAEQYVQQYNPEIESMEGAAFHYVCLQEGLSFIQLRSISNPVGERDKSKWKLKDAIENLNKELLHLIRQVPSHL